MTLAEFRRVYPTAAFTVSSGKLFTYRYYQNPQAKATLVLLTGGIGPVSYTHLLPPPIPSLTRWGWSATMRAS